MIKITLSVLLILMAIFISYEVLAQCQGQYTNDSGPSRYQHGLIPTNVLEQKKDFQLSLYQNIKKGNLDNRELVFLVLNFMLMFFCIYSPKKKFFKLSMAMYAIPFIIYFIRYPLLPTDSMIFMVFITLGMFLWGSSFSFCFRINLKSLLSLLSMAVFLLLFMGGFKIANLSHLGEGFNYVNYYLFNGQFEKNLILLSHVLVGFAAMTFLYFIYALLFIKPPLLKGETRVSGFYYLNRTLVFLWWGGFFIYASNLGAYMVTWFVIGATLRDKEILEDSFKLINKFPYLLIAVSIMTIIFLAKYILKQDQELRDWLMVISVVAIITLVHLFCLSVLKMIFKKKLSLIDGVSIFPTFRVAMIFRGIEDYTTFYRSNYHLITLTFLSLLGYFIP